MLAEDVKVGGGGWVGAAPGQAEEGSVVRFVYLGCAWNKSVCVGGKKGCCYREGRTGSLPLMLPAGMARPCAACSAGAGGCVGGEGWVSW